MSIIFTIEKHHLCFTKREKLSVYTSSSFISIR
jgi:hypothetical protein